MLPHCFAAKYYFEPYFNAQEILTDNVNRTNAGKESDFVTVLQPGLYATRNGSRFKTRFNYAPQQIIYGGSTSDNTVHNLATDGNVEFFDNHFFTDFSIKNSQQNTSSFTSQSEDNISNNTSRDNVLFYSVNPFWKQNISDLAKLTIGHSYDEIISGAGDSNSNLSYINIVNGTRFTRLLFDFQMYNNFVEIDSADDSRFSSIKNRFIYPLTRTFSATATLGYDDNEIITSGDTSGVLWNAGFIWRPSRRTNVDISVGERYFGTDINVDARYAYSKIEVRLSYSQTQQTTRNFLTFEPSQVLFDRGASGLLDKDGNLIDNRGFANPTVLNNATIGQRSEAVLSDQLRAVFIYRLKRDELRLTTFVDENEFQLSGDQTDSYGIDFGWSRNLSRTLTSNVNLTYQNRNLTTGIETNDYLVDVSLAKNFSQTLSAVLGFSVSLFESEAGSAAGFLENRIFVGLNKTF